MHNGAGKKTASSTTPNSIQFLDNLVILTFWLTYLPIFFFFFLISVGFKSNQKRSLWWIGLFRCLASQKKGEVTALIFKNVLSNSA